MRQISLITDVTISDMVTMGYDMNTEVVMGTVGIEELSFVRNIDNGLYYLIQNSNDFRRLCRYYQSYYKDDTYKTLFNNLKKDIVDNATVAYLPDFTEEVF